MQSSSLKVTHPTETTDAPHEELNAPKPRGRRPWAAILLLGGLAAAGTFAYRWWAYNSVHQETDDAYVVRHLHPISSRISGTVIQVLIHENQHVTQGQPLVRLDPTDLQLQLKQALANLRVAEDQAAAAHTTTFQAIDNARAGNTQAQAGINAAQAAIATAQAQVQSARAGVSQAQAQLAQAQANLYKYHVDYLRYQRLYGAGAVTQEDLDTARQAYQVALAQQGAQIQAVHEAQANLAAALQGVKNAQAQFKNAQGAIQQAQGQQVQTQIDKNNYTTDLATVAQDEVAVRNARQQLSYTSILAPTSGVVGDRTVEVGEQVTPGLPLLSVVGDQVWVVANFKETQLERMRPGQSVTIDLDTFPNHPFQGRVESISPASGADFALLPPDNATGNFTKIVQRIPVKILFDPASIRGYESLVRSGMSATVSVDVGSSGHP